VSTRLGTGGSGPWENRHTAVRELHPNPAAVGGWLNATYSVQLYRHPTHPGADHLLVRRHDEGTEIPWADLQAIKDRLATDGQLRWAVEVFPHRQALVDNCNLRHVWVMPKGWTPPVDLREVRT
jgi:hypothetical protein